MPVAEDPGLAHQDQTTAPAEPDPSLPQESDGDPVRLEDLPPAGWYNDPAATDGLMRYWDGQSWTEHVHQPQESAAPDTTNSGAESAGTETHYREPEDAASALAPEFETEPATSERQKIGVFGARKAANQLMDENEVLQRRLSSLERTVAKYGLLELAEREQHLTALDGQLAETARNLNSAKAELQAVQSDLIERQDSAALQELGIFDYDHPAEHSATLSTQLESLRQRIKQANKLGTAIHASVDFTFNNSTAKGRTFVNQMSRIMLRAYNAEAENAVKSVKTGNLAPAQKRLSTAAAQIAKQGTMIDLRISDAYHRMRLEEVELAARHLQAVAQEREREREHRAELREQRKVEQEIQRERERLDKERNHFLNAARKMREQGNEAGALELEGRLAQIDTEIVELDYREANIRAGYVYVISNLGSFGEGVVKIGMTRRLEPMDRVRELGDASVPFRFDIHALFFSEDAVEIEAMLHRQFAAKRINRVNPRKEFFRVTPAAVLEALHEHRVSVVEFTTEAAAEEYRSSWPEEAAPTS
jgi:hypothetical protein